MKTAIFFLAALVLISSQAAESIQTRLTSFSILFRAASAKRPISRIIDINEVSSQPTFPPAPDGELAPAPQDQVPTTHWGTFIFTDNQFAEIIPMFFILDVPKVDSDGNGIPDIFEFEGSIANITTDGAYEEVDGEVGAVTAVWNKPANSHTGTCAIQLGLRPGQTFNHPIEIMDYRGVLQPWTVTGTTAKGQTTLVRQGVPTDTLSGEMTFSLATAGKVSLTSTTLLDETGAEFKWLNPGDLTQFGNEFTRALDVFDGTPEEPLENFFGWFLTMRDPNDADGDGSPDLIDPPTTQPAAPRLEIVKTANGVRLLIHGDIGRAYTLEDAITLPTAQWLHPTTVTLSADPHIIDLPAPTSPTFWRMRFP